MSPPAEIDYRLPTNVRPTHYDLTVRTDLIASTFDGIVTIDLIVEKDISTIVLNSVDLTLTNVTLTSSDLTSALGPTAMDFDETMERCTLKFSQNIRAGAKAQLKIVYEGLLTDALMGYYKSVGGEQVYALTQFQPTAARRAFPCWDEPLLKATFAVTMISHADTTSLSNMSIKSQHVYDPKAAQADSFLSCLAEKLASDQWKISKFETSPPMSTYLVAYANGRFEYLENEYTSPLSGKRRPLRIYATKDIIDKTQFALDVTGRLLPLYEKVFDVEYPLPKLDTLIAHDFDSGAMENWGLITGRTSAYAIDPNSGDLQTMKDIAGTQCHEVAHMWFGNIATMAWWDNLYLNEGFATLMGEVIILDKIFPEWKLHSSFVSEHHNYALDVDANLSSHPIEVECPDANMINQIFDDLSYSKAASVLRMLSTYVGEEKFLKGVSIYLKKHLYANTVTRDLWEGIGEASGIGVPDMMDNWVKKTGFPVLTVSETDAGIRVRQDRFLGTGPAATKDNETVWTVPLSLLTANKQGKAIVNTDEVLTEREKTIALDVNKPFKINAGTVTFCRVLYPPERLVKIGQEATKTDSPFSAEDRMGLVDDAFALSKAGYSSVSSALALVDVLRNEPEYLVWESIYKNLFIIRSVWWEYQDIVDASNAFLQELSTPLVERLGYDYSAQDSADTRELRTLIINAAAAGESPKIVEELRRRFAQYMNTGEDSQIPPELERIIYSTAVWHGGRAEWEAVKKIAVKPKNPTAGVAALYAVGVTQDLDTASDTWRFMMEDVRLQDFYFVIGGLEKNPKTRRLLLKFFKENYSTLDKRFEGNYNMQSVVERCHRDLSSDKDYEETAEFFKDKDTSKYKIVLDQALEGIQTRSAWLKRSTNDVRQWFEKREGSKL